MAYFRRVTSFLRNAVFFVSFGDCSIQSHHVLYLMLLSYLEMFTSYLSFCVKFSDVSLLSLLLMQRHCRNFNWFLVSRFFAYGEKPNFLHDISLCY